MRWAVESVPDLLFAHSAFLAGSVPGESRIQVSCLHHGGFIGNKINHKQAIPGVPELKKLVSYRFVSFCVNKL